jgi:hypothetical protein
MSLPAQAGRSRSVFAIYVLLSIESYCHLLRLHSQPVQHHPPLGRNQSLLPKGPGIFNIRRCVVHIYRIWASRYLFSDTSFLHSRRPAYSSNTSGYETDCSTSLIYLHRWILQRLRSWFRHCRGKLLPVDRRNTGSTSIERLARFCLGLLGLHPVNVGFECTLIPQAIKGCEPRDRLLCWKTSSGSSAYRHPVRCSQLRIWNRQQHFFR